MSTTQQEQDIVPVNRVNLKQAARMVNITLRARKVPMIWGSPAIGKSSIVHQVADAFGLKVIDVRLSQCDPTDLAGFPHIYEVKNSAGVVVSKKAGYISMDTFPLRGDPLPKRADGTEYNGWLLFFDESSSAPRAVQAACYKILLDRMVGLQHLHDNVAMVCAGNMESDGAIVEPMSTAMQSRLVHMETVVDLEVFIDYASRKKWDYRILSYLQHMPGHLYTFSPDHTDHTYSAPRTWEFANDILQQGDVKDPDILALLAGTLSEGVARPFQMYCDIVHQLPTMPQILAAPDKAVMPDEPSVLFMLTGMLSHHASATNAGALMTYIARMPVEFQIVTMRQTLRRNPKIGDVKEVDKWVQDSALDLF